MIEPQEFKALLRHLNEHITAYNEKNPDAEKGEREVFARAKADEVIAEAVLPEGLDATALIDRLMDHALGMGDLQPLMDDADISNIEINGYDNVFIHRRSQPGFKKWNGTIGDSNEELIDLVHSMSNLGETTREQPWNLSDWRTNLRLADGSRLHGIMAVSAHPLVTIRKHDYALSHLQSLVDNGTMPTAVGQLLAAMVFAKANIVVSGGTNSGKTTLLRALLNIVPPTERIITAEDIPELAVGKDAARHPNVCELEALAPNQDGKGGATLTEIMRETLRMNPDRVVVGEIRGAEITEMVRAMSQGNDGSMCSIHADNAQKAVSRLVRYYGEGGHTRQDAHTAIGDAVDFIIHLGVRNGRRTLRQVLEVGESDPTGNTPPLTNPLIDDTAGVWRIGSLSDEWWGKLEDSGFRREVLEDIRDLPTEEI